MTLPSKNLSTVLWINLIGAVIASGVLLSTRLASKVEVPGIPKGRKEVGKNTNKTANKDWSGKILGVAVLAMILLTIVSSITRISSIDEIYQTIPLKTEEKAEVLTSAKETPIAIAPQTAKRKMLQKFSVIPNSNMFTLDGITAQVVNGEYVYVATVEFNGFFKWLKLGKYLAISSLVRQISTHSQNL